MLAQFYPIHVTRPHSVRKEKEKFHPHSECTKISIIKENSDADKNELITSILLLCFYILLKF